MKDILSLGFLSWFEIVISNESIHKVVGFFVREGFRMIKYLSLLCCACLSFNDPIALD